MDVEWGSQRATVLRAWIVGGILLLASVVVGVGAQPQVFHLPGGSVPAQFAFSAALVVLAVGIRGVGSVTARRPLGTIALCLLAVVSFGTAVLREFAYSGAGLPADTATALGYAIPIIQFVLALVAVVQIARAGVVPAPWNWSAAWMLAAVTSLTLIEWLVTTGSPQATPEFATVLIALEGVVSTGAPIFLGVLAIALAERSRTWPLPVTEPSATPN